MQDRYALGVDIGGTFTDFTLFDRETRQLKVGKRLTTPHQPDEAVLSGVDALGGDRILADAESFTHATTLVTNVIIERKGALTGLITTEGFRDILEMRRENRYDVYDLTIDFPKPLVPRPLRRGVRERVLANGVVMTPMNEDDVHAACDVFEREGVEAVAICLLHSYRFPDHEKRAREIVLSRMPHVAISVSHEVNPEPREYERTSSTVVDAYVKPIAERYIERLAGALADKGYGREMFVMLSNGGTATSDIAKKFPAQFVESGPAAGVEAARGLGRKLGFDKLLSFDMGGTTAKLCLVEDGRAARARAFEVDRVHRFKAGSGIPVSVPVYDLLEIGAGGGSIAQLNALGLLQVGPQSAGSSPGPACYGLGGENPTVTDADLVLGYLDPNNFLGGDMKLDLEAAGRAVDAKLAGPMGKSRIDSAWGVHNLVNETMAAAARVYVVEKGRNAADLALFAFGGAGPVHALGLARKLGCRTVVVPRLPGVMSAFGLLTAPISFERSFAERRPLAECDLERLEARTSALEADAARHLPEPEQATFTRLLDLWYIGQSSPIEIEMKGRWNEPGAIGRIVADFHAEYRRLYGRIDEDNDLELVSVRVAASRPGAAIENGPVTSDSAPEPKTRRAWSQTAGHMMPFAIHDRDALSAGTRIEGPALIEERESTTMIDKGDTLVVDDRGALVVTLATPRPLTDDGD